ncbi:MAG: exodeoxyribonuclease VII large subunit [Candidatus Marinimicrobia bacterium]|nr:exodeoxyribonuclease VII large subunit [Candidatus Neomarinimicrobiota bacterium]|tara:strand:+ start:161 stop:1354 length:1194 start_codon:yes stop_codon:yes gene_type:complete
MPEHRNYLSVSDLNSKIRYSLEKDLSSIWVKGELSNFHHHPSSGHMYFTLKDELNEIRCAMFRANNQFLKFNPLDGMSIRLFGDITFYEQRGSLQIKVSIMEEDGVGDLHKAFEKMKSSLEKEGLFDKKYKKKLPRYPKKIGIITSGSGAAIKDIFNVLGRRAPQVKLILKSVKVQGDDAPNQISKAIELFNSENCVDVLIIGRGGGSIEDLWAFNEEIVARSIFKSLIPIISAVGHETDFSISDFVSDVRAPTPSAAAEIAVISKDAILKNLKSLEKQIIDLIMLRLEKYWVRKDQLERRISISKPQVRILNSIELLNKYYERLVYVNNQNFIHYKNNLESLLKRLVGLGPHNVLERGFSIPTDIKGNIIKSPDQIKVGDIFNLKTAKGSFKGRKI